MEQNIDDIPQRDVKTFDARKYKGMKVKLADVRMEEVVDFFSGPEDDEGRPTYNAFSTTKKKVIIIETERLPELDKDGNITDVLSEITVKRRFNLKKEIVNGQINWVISKHSKADLWAFMRNMKAIKLSDLKGMNVVLTSVADKNSDEKFWLRISD